MSQKKVGFTATIISSKSDFFWDTLWLIAKLILIQYVMYFLELLFFLQKVGRQRMNNTSFGIYARREYYIRPKHLFSSIKWEYNKQPSIKRNLITKKVVHINVSTTQSFA